MLESNIHHSIHADGPTAFPFPAGNGSSSVWPQVAIGRCNEVGEIMLFCYPYPHNVNLSFKFQPTKISTISYITGYWEIHQLPGLFPGGNNWSGRSNHHQVQRRMVFCLWAWEEQTWSLTYCRISSRMNSPAFLAMKPQTTILVLKIFQDSTQK